MHAILAAALAGLMATPHCAGMCGGFAAACARPVSIERRTPRPRRPATPGLWSWHAGRLTTYALLGAFASAFGRLLPGPAWVPAALSAALLVWFAASLAGLLPQPSARVPGLARAGALLAGRSSFAGRYVFGLVTGLLPCGMVYAALSLAIAAAQPLHGAVAMLAFGAATVPGLTLLSAGVQRFAARGLWARRAVAATVLALGLWAVGVRGAGAHASHPQQQPAATHAH
jgi:uncharacterized protein